MQTGENSVTEAGTPYHGKSYTLWSYLQ